MSSNDPADAPDVSRSDQDVSGQPPAHPPVEKDDIVLTTDDEAQRDDLPVKPTNS